MASRISSGEPLKYHLGVRDVHVAQIGRQERQFVLRVVIGAIPADKGGGREAMA